MSAETSVPPPVIDKPQKVRWKRRLLHVQWRLRQWSQKILGWVIIGVGMVFLSVGLIFALLPGHIGLPVMIIGLIMVLRNAFWARRQFIRLKHRHPNWIMPVRKLLRRNPPIASVFWQQILKTERMILRKGRALAVWRRRLRRKAKATI